MRASDEASPRVVVRYWPACINMKNEPSAVRRCPSAPVSKADPQSPHSKKCAKAESKAPLALRTLAAKWATANIALQVFCKAGKVPWKVRPTSDRSLIIGISQSHKVRVVNAHRVVEKHFAFSILTDRGCHGSYPFFRRRLPDPSAPSAIRWIMRLNTKRCTG